MKYITWTIGQQLRDNSIYKLMEMLKLCCLHLKTFLRQEEQRKQERLEWQQKEDDRQMDMQRELEHQRQVHEKELILLQANKDEERRDREKRKKNNGKDAEID